MAVTLLLRKAGCGDKQALDEVMPLAYEALRRLARAQLRYQGDVTLNATALAHAAFLRLVGGAQPAYENRSHFYGIASRLMRHVLVDVIRNRRAQKGPWQKPFIWRGWRSSVRIARTFSSN
jgi:DNA-directed RNA polymerase specialized sigma24 family protein